MGHWGIRSYENDDAADALDAGFARAHGDAYDELMDDHNPLSPEQIQQKLAGPATLEAAVEALREAVGRPWEEWDEVDRLAFVGVIVRHAELGVPIPDDHRDRAAGWLRDETAEWDEATARRLRRQKEIDLVSGPGPAGPGGH